MYKDTQHIQAFHPVSACVTSKVAGWLPRLAPLLAIFLGLAVNLLALTMAAEVFMVVLMLVMFLGWKLSTV